MRGIRSAAKPSSSALPTLRAPEPAASGSVNATTPTASNEMRFNMDTAPLGPPEGLPLPALLFGARRAQNVRQPAVALVARVFELAARLGVALQRHRERPRLLPRRRVFETGFPPDRVGPHQREALGHLQVGAGAAIGIGLVEVRRLDHQRIALEVA